ncbi:glycosyltransferase family 4 protein [Parvularcula oceani]|uniref:glycosyltransferase family 4 protein n=1 Tax=Parvularcula oceani TaxID=1247963 RepID=UPI000690AC48|nr:glycosyltransferase family 4 protein [Parvularcula oceani]
MTVDLDYTRRSRWPDKRLPLDFGAAATFDQGGHRARRPLRITIVHCNGHGALVGGFRMIADYAEALRSAGHSVTLISPKPARERLFGGPWRRLPLYRKAQLQDDFLRGRGLNNIVLDRTGPLAAADLPDADIVMATWWETAEWVRALPPAKGRKIHFVQGYEMFDYLPLDRVRAVLDDPMPKILVAPWLERILREEHGATDVTVVPNAVDTTRFVPPTRDGIPEPRFGLLFSKTPIKNMPLARSAFDLARRGRSDLSFISFGATAPGADELTALERFALRPPQAEIPSLYGACRAWLLPSTSEGFGLPILEAMACGTPVISTAVGAAPDIIDGTNGIIVDAQPQAFAMQIRRFADMPAAEWLMMSKRARATAERFSRKGGGRSFEQAVRQLAQRGEGSAASPAPRQELTEPA